MDGFKDNRDINPDDYLPKLLANQPLKTTDIKTPYEYLLEKFDTCAIARNFITYFEDCIVVNSRNSSNNSYYNPNPINIPNNIRNVSANNYYNPITNPSSRENSDNLVNNSDNSALSSGNPQLIYSVNSRNTSEDRLVNLLNNTNISRNSSDNTSFNNRNPSADNLTNPITSTSSSRNNSETNLINPVIKTSTSRNNSDNNVINPKTIVIKSRNSSGDSIGYPLNHTNNSRNDSDSNYINPITNNVNSRNSSGSNLINTHDMTNNYRNISVDNVINPISNTNNSRNNSDINTLNTLTNPINTTTNSRNTSVNISHNPQIKYSGYHSGNFGEFYPNDIPDDDSGNPSQTFGYAWQFSVNKTDKYTTELVIMLSQYHCLKYLINKNDNYITVYGNTNILPQQLICASAVRAQPKHNPIKKQIRIMQNPNRVIKNINTCAEPKIVTNYKSYAEKKQSYIEAKARIMGISLDDARAEYEKEETKNPEILNQDIRNDFMTKIQQVAKNANSTDLKNGSLDH